MSIGVTGAYAAYNVYQAAAKDFNYRAAHNGENMDPTALDAIEKSAISRKSSETLKMAKDFVNVKDDKNENSKVDTFERSRPEERENIYAKKRDEDKNTNRTAEKTEDPAEKRMNNAADGEDFAAKHMEAMAKKAKEVQAERDEAAAEKIAEKRLQNAANDERIDRSGRSDDLAAERPGAIERPAELQANREVAPAGETPENNEVQAQPTRAEDEVAEAQERRAEEFRNRYADPREVYSNRMDRNV